MRRLVTIDLSIADIAAFEAYEATVLPLVAAHGGRVEMRVRSLDGQAETHLLFFPDADAFDHYRNDPIRVAALPTWDASGANAVAVEVESVTA